MVAIQPLFGGALHQLPCEHPFGNAVQTTAYLAIRPEGGNVLFYGSGHMADCLDGLEALGGVWRQLVNHRDEATPGADLVKERFGAPLWCHSLEREACAQVCHVGDTFEQGPLTDDIEAIHTPGHCPGSTCLLWQTPNGQRILFTGDTFYPSKGRWTVAIAEEHRDQMRASLQKLTREHIDALVPSLFIGEVMWLEGADAVQDALKQCIERLKAPKGR